jgi:hypothetical protein
MVQGSQTQWVPILQYSGHRSKLTKQTMNLKIYSLNSTISPLKYVKTKNPPPTSDSRTHSPNTLFLLPHKKISDTRDWTTDARALWERERERERETRASEQARKHGSLRSYVRARSAGTSRGSGPGRGVARHVTSGGEPYPLSLGPLASTEWSLNQRGFN